MWLTKQILPSEQVFNTSICTSFFVNGNSGFLWPFLLAHWEERGPFPKLMQNWQKSRGTKVMAKKHYVLVYFILGCDSIKGQFGCCFSPPTPIIFINTSKHPQINMIKITIISIKNKILCSKDRSIFRELCHFAHIETFQVKILFIIESLGDLPSSQSLCPFHQIIAPKPFLHRCSYPPPPTPHLGHNPTCICQRMEVPKCCLKTEME